MTLYAQESQNVNVECSHHQKVSTYSKCGQFNFKIPAIEPSSYDTWYAPSRKAMYEYILHLKKYVLYYYTCIKTCVRVEIICICSCDVRSSQYSVHGVFSTIIHYSVLYRGKITEIQSCAPQLSIVCTSIGGQIVKYLQTLTTDNLF